MLKRGLPLPKLRIRDKRKSRISPQLRPIGKLAKTAGGLLFDSPVFGQDKAVRFEDKNGLPNRRELLADSPRCRPIAKQGWEPVELVPEGPPHKDCAAATEDPAKLPSA